MITGLLIIFSLGLIAAEFFFPGGIFATIGVILSLILYFYLFISFVSYQELFFVTSLFVGGLWLTIRMCVRHIKNARDKDTFFLHNSQTRHENPLIDKQYIGFEGIAKTPLKLSGYISIQGQQYPALSQEFIEKGEKITIMECKSSYYLVKKMEVQ